MFQRRNAAAAACIALAGVLVIGCGQWHAPASTSPSDLGGSFGNTGDGGVVAGTVRSAAHAMGAASAVSPMTVTVVGTTIKAVVSASGNFRLEHVPAGAIRLQFSGSGVNASVDGGTLHDHETVEFQLTVSVTTVVVDATMRVSGDGTAELEGPVTQISGSCPSATVSVGTFSGSLSSSVNDCSSIRVGVRVRLVGRRMNATVIVVVRVEVNVTTTTPKPPSGDDDDDDGDDD
jgi:hypothetical protein